MKAVITGAAGHVGANLVRSLLARGVSTRVLVHRSTEGLAGLAVETVQASVTDGGALREAFAGADIVFHLASHISLLHRDRRIMQAVNVEGTRCVVEACRAAGVGRLVHVSSIEALSPYPLDGVVTESRELVQGSGFGPYAESKAQAERIVREAVSGGLDAVVIYPTAIFGPHDYKPSFFGQALIRMAEGRLPALLNAGFDWVDVRDVVDGLLRAAEQGAPGSRYLLSGQWQAIPQIAAAVARLSGQPAVRFTAPVWLAKVGAPFIEAFAEVNGEAPLYTRTSLRALSAYHKVSSERAARELGYAPRNFSDSLGETLRWFAEQGKVTGKAAQHILEVASSTNDNSSQS